MVSSLDSIKNAYLSQMSAFSTGDAAAATAYSATANTGSAQAAVDSYEGSIQSKASQISTLDAAIKQELDSATKEELQAKRTALIKEKAELEAKQKALKSQIEKIKAEAESIKSKINYAKTELKSLNSDKNTIQTQVNAEQELLNGKKEDLTTIEKTIAVSKSELENTISDLKQSADEMTEKSEQQLKEQRTAISAATTEALALCESGQLEYADIPSYVADKLKGANSMGEVAGFSIVDAKNSKVKAICSQLSELTNQKAKLEISIKASETKIELSTPLLVDINTSIKAKSNEISSYEDQYKSKNNEIAAKNTECSSAETKVQGIDAQLAYIDIRLAAEEASAAQAQTSTNQTNQSAPAKNSLFGQFTTNVTEQTAGSSIDDELAKINQEYEEILNSDVINSDIAELKAKMEESDKVVLTLRNKLTDNAQKIINERLEATRRV